MTIDNGIGESGATAIINAVRKITTLKELYMGGTETQRFRGFCCDLIIGNDVSIVWLMNKFESSGLSDIAGWCRNMGEEIIAKKANITPKEVEDTPERFSSQCEDLWCLLWAM